MTRAVAEMSIPHRSQGLELNQEHKNVTMAKACEPGQVKDGFTEKYGLGKAIGLSLQRMGNQFLNQGVVQPDRHI